MATYNQQKINLKNVILPTIYEYLLILLPVSIYVGIEAMHTGPRFFYTSPEWSIASIFLNFQAIALYYRRLNNSNRKINADFLLILILGVVAITILSSLNAYASLTEIDTNGKIALRICLLAVSSLFFFVMVLASKTENN